MKTSIDLADVALIEGMGVEKILKIGRDFQHSDPWRGATHDTAKLLCDTIEVLNKKLNGYFMAPVEPDPDLKRPFMAINFGHGSEAAAAVMDGEGHVITFEFRNSEIEGLKDAIREEDAIRFRYRPRLPIKQSGIYGPAYMDVGGEGPWRLSAELWYAMQHGINAELYCHSGKGGLRRIFIEDGWKVLDEPMDKMRELCDPEKIVSGAIRKFNNKKGKAK